MTLFVSFLQQKCNNHLLFLCLLLPFVLTNVNEQSGLSSCPYTYVVYWNTSLDHLRNTKSFFCQVITTSTTFFLSHCLTDCYRAVIIVVIVVDIYHFSGLCNRKATISQRSADSRTPFQSRWNAVPAAPERCHATSFKTRMPCYGRIRLQKQWKNWWKWYYFTSSTTLITTY